MLNAALRDIADDHLTRVARKHDIRLRRTKTWDTSECNDSTRTAFIPRECRTALDYLVSLHEIGHLVEEGAMGYSPATVAECLRIEAAAWAWAAERALPQVLRSLTKTDLRRIGHCWASYIGDVW